jgi:hypothetical protein
MDSPLVISQSKNETWKLNKAYDTEFSQNDLKLALSRPWAGHDGL